MSRQLTTRWFLGCCVWLLLPLSATAQRVFTDAEQGQIGITVQQQKELTAVFAAAKSKRRAVQGYMRSLYQKLQGLYDTYEFDPEQARTLRQEIVKKQERLLALHAEDEASLRRILTKEQFERLRALMKAERERHRNEDHRRGHDEDHHEP